MAELKHERTRWVIYTKVDYIKEKFTRRYNSGRSIACNPQELPQVAGQYEDVSSGWYVNFEGSSESIFLSDSEPDLHAGDKVKITIEKVADAKPRQPPVKYIRQASTDW